MISTSSGLRLEVRPGTKADVPVLMAFIRSLAQIEKLSVSTTEETLQAALFGDSPAAETVIALVDGTPIAYVIYYFTFASTVGERGLWVDDVFVDSAHRGKGIGQALMAYMADLAVSEWLRAIRVGGPELERDSRPFL